MNLLVSLLNDSERVDALTPFEWELLFRQARAAGLMERLSELLSDDSVSVPECAQTHLASASVFFASQQRIVHWELFQLKEIFKALNIPLILLKGSAYVAANLDARRGRVFNDIDLLVPRDALEKVKNALVWHGWFMEEMDAYDKQYYQRWMHELPPMKHIERQTSLDIHHNILPITSDYCPDAGLLLQKVVEINGADCFVLSPEDMVLHSASHLFLNGEFENGLRDLTDLDLLLRQFDKQQDAFYPKLLARAKQLGLMVPLTFALRYTASILRTPVPDDALNELKVASGIKIRFFDFLFKRALMPDHPSCNDRWTGLARFLLYIRSHWLKMPLYLLIPHLLRKSWMRMTGKAAHG